MGFEFATARRMDPTCDAAEDFSRIEHEAPFDLSESVIAVNRAREAEPALASARAPVMLAGAGSACVALLRGATRHPHQGDRASLILANADPSHRHGCAASTLVEAAGGAFARFEAVLPRAGTCSFARRDGDAGTRRGRALPRGFDHPRRSPIVRRCARPPSSRAPRRASPSRAISPSRGERSIPRQAHRRRDGHGGSRRDRRWP